MPENPEPSNLLEFKPDMLNPSWSWFFMITVYYSLVVFLAPISIDFPFKFYFDGHSIGCWFMALFTTRLKGNN